MLLVNHLLCFGNIYTELQRACYHNIFIIALDIGFSRIFLKYYKVCMTRKHAYVGKMIR